MNNKVQLCRINYLCHKLEYVQNYLSTMITFPYFHSDVPFDWEKGEAFLPTGVSTKLAPLLSPI